MANNHPSNVQTLGAMIDGRVKLQVWCDTCKAYKDFTQEELVALAEKVGRDYSLIDRRCRCRLTLGCKGWNQFCYMRGVMRNLRTDAGMARWLFKLAEGLDGERGG